MPAKLPEHLLNPPYRLLSDMQVGETAYVLRSDMVVNKSRECFLDPSAITLDRSSDVIQVDRREDGYHVVLIVKEMKWRTFVLNEEKGVPVVTIREIYDPALIDSMTKLKTMSGAK